MIIPKDMPENLDVTLSDTDLIRQLLKEEQDAVISYTERSEQTSDPRVKDVFRDIAREEKVHAGELEALLAVLDPEQEDTAEEGEEEVEEMKVDEAWEDFKKSNQTSVEDKLDTLLAIENEIRVDTERTAEAIPEILADSTEDDTVTADEIVDDEKEGDEAESVDDAYAWMDDLDSDVLEEGENPEEPVEGDEEGEPVSEDEPVDEVAEDAEEEPVAEESEVAEEFDEDGEDDVIEDEEVVDEAPATAEEEPVVEEAESEEEPVAEDEAPAEEEAPVEVEEESEEEETVATEEPVPEEPEEEDEEKRPTTKTIKSIASRGPKIIVGRADVPPYSLTAGNVAKMASLDDLISGSEPVEMGHGVNPRDVVANDLELYKMVKRFNGIL